MVKFLAGASFVCIAMVLAGVNRGFDISDEGLYVLLADPHQQNVAGIFNYDLFFKLIFKLTGYSFSLVELRITRLLSYLAGAYALARFWKNIRNESQPRPEIFLISLLALMAGFAFLPPSLSYNSLSVVLICFWLGLVSGREVTFSVGLAIGLLLSLLVYIKVTLALIFIPLSILVLWKRSRLQILFTLLVPFLLFELLFLGFFGENACTRLFAGIPHTSSRPSYQIGSMLKSIAVGGFWIACSATLFFIVGYARRVNSKLGILFFVIATMGIVTLSYLTHITEEWNHLVLILTAGGLGYCFGRGSEKATPPSLWLGLLLLLPFFLHLGSNVYWLRIGIHYWVFWVLAAMLCFENGMQWVKIAVPLITVLLVFNGIWAHPFGQDKPLWAQKHPWNRDGRETVQLDPELLGIMDALREGGGDDPSQPILAAYRIPGLAWLSGTQVPFSPGIWDQNQLNTFFETKPEKMIFNHLDSLPPDWRYTQHRDLGTYQGDSLQLLWD